MYASSKAYMVTETQRETLKIIGADNKRFHPSHANSASSQLGITQGALSARVGEMFEDFEELLKLVDENFAIFERRFKTHPELYKPLRSIARKMKRR